jgi:dihydroflavonol-4-reductase
MNLVTGPTGHIGNVLVRELVRRGEKVRALVLPGEDLTPIADLDVEIVYGNVLDKPSLTNAFIDITMYSIWPVLFRSLRERINWFTKSMLKEPGNMVEAAMEVGVKRFIYTSSIHAFKRIPHGSIVDEMTPIEPETSMGHMIDPKLKPLYIFSIKLKQGLPAVIACPTGVVGPYDLKKSEIGELVNDWIMKKVNYMIEGSYDFVDVRDVVEGLILARDKGQVGQIYILSGEWSTFPIYGNSVKNYYQSKPGLLTFPPGWKICCLLC